MKIINETRNKVLAEEAAVANTTFSRMQGLLGKSDLAQGQGLIIKPASSIHTFFMRFTIDAIFVDKHNRVIAIYPDMTSFRLSGLHLNASLVIELPAGVIRATGTQVGNIVSMF